MVPQLTVIEARVLGCLMEKEATTPENYPITLNSLIAACNQKSNRWPVMSLAENTVVDSIDSLRYGRNLVSQVMTHGSRVPKYKHDVLHVLGLSKEEAAILCELMLRGPQTLGELRIHTARMCTCDEPGKLADALRRLEEDADGPIVVHLARESGHRERRFAHLLCGEVVVEAAAEQDAESYPASPEPHRESRMTVLETEITALRAEVDELKRQIAAIIAGPKTGDSD